MARFAAQFEHKNLTECKSSDNSIVDSSIKLVSSDKTIKTSDLFKKSLTIVD